MLGLHGDGNVGISLGEPSEARNEPETCKGRGHADGKDAGGSFAWHLLRGVRENGERRLDGDNRSVDLYLNPGSAGPRRFRLPVTIARVRVSGRTLIPEIVTLES
jgi:hypothetical protein